MLFLHKIRRERQSLNGNLEYQRENSFILRGTPIVRRDTDYHAVIKTAIAVVLGFVRSSIERTG